MAILSDEQAKALIKAPRNSAEIQRAREKRDRHRLHTSAEVSTNNVGAGAQLFFSWVNDLLKGGQNFPRFRVIARPPYATNKLTDGIFTAFEKVFESKNSYERFEFTAPDLEVDFAAYRKRIGDLNFWETQGMETFKQSIDDILVVDMPSLPMDEEGIPIMDSDYPEPYYFILDIGRVHDIENDKVTATDQSGKEFIYFKTEYLIFKRKISADIDRFFVLDDQSYRAFDVDKGADPLVKMEFFHGLGFCPARSFWTSPLNADSKVLKSGPITDSLSDLDWLLFYSISQRYVEIYASFPMYAMYKRKCDYKEDKGSGRQCMNGVLAMPGLPFPAEADRVYCPKCQGGPMVGPGVVTLIDPPREKSDEYNLMADPMKVISADVQSLDYIMKRIDGLKNQILVDSIGRSHDTNDAAAKNELQVESGFEASEDILLKIKRNFEIIHSFALDTVARLRYGTQYKGGMVNYGDQFFVKDEAQELAEYKDAKEQGLPEYTLAERRKDINEARYRNDPKMLERLRILENLEPFPGMDIAAVGDLRKSDDELVSVEDYFIKVYFLEFINRFEREQAPLTVFGSNASFDKKVQQIRTELEKYAKEKADKLLAQKKPADPPPVPPVPPPGPGTPPAPPLPPAPAPDPAKD